MGSVSSDLASVFAPSEPRRNFLLVGLDAAGKTTVLYKLSGGQVKTTIPTIGFNVESVLVRGALWTVWDVGGRCKTRALWRHFYQGMNGLIIVVDSNDVHRLDQLRDELRHLLEEEHLKSHPLLILCNKQDLPNSLSPEDIVERLKIGEELVAKEDRRQWTAVGCSALHGKGLHEGLAWLGNAVRVGEETMAKGITTSSDPITSETSKTPDDETASPTDLVSMVGYDPTENTSNTTLEHFGTIQRNTLCPFAKSAKLWGGRLNHSPSSLEDQAKRNTAALIEFVRRSNAGEALDGFCIEIDDSKAREGGPEELGRCVCRILKALSDHDPSGESVMRVNYIGSRGWRFRFAKADFFVTTFAPCYPLTSSRYAYGTGRAFLLLQPELSFARHNLPFDTPETKWENPKTVRDRTRVAFRDADQSYHIPKTVSYPPAEHIVKPINDDGVAVVRWWKHEAA